jgi:hypothetical protein
VRQIRTIAQSKERPRNAALNFTVAVGLRRVLRSSGGSSRAKGKDRDLASRARRNHDVAKAIPTRLLNISPHPKLAQK